MDLKTQRLVIRFITGEDWPALIDIWSDFEGSPYARYDGPHDLDPEVVKEKAGTVIFMEKDTPGRA